MDGHVPPRPGAFDLTTVAIHEFGHALGLNHSPVVGSVMEAFYGGPRRVLHADDIAGITSIYGGYNIADASWVHGTSVQVELPDTLAVDPPLRVLHAGHRQGRARPTGSTSPSRRR